MKLKQNLRVCLDSIDVQFWKQFLADNLKVGTEIEVAVPRGSNRDKFHASLLETLRPSKNYKKFGKYGIYNVEVEHCGIEIQVIGVAPYYPSLLKQYQRIIKPLFDLKARTKATCGLHFHFLCDSMINPMPEIILANLWNITRFFAAELKFITGAGERPRGICRRRNYNSHLEMVKWEAGELSLKSIQKKLKESVQVPEHQNFFNLEHLNFTTNEDIANLHYEFRFPDVDLCPTTIVTKIFLGMALLFRAIEISKLGLAVVEDRALWDKKISLLDRISNNAGPLAESDTRSLDGEDFRNLRSGASDLITFLRSELLHFPQNPSLKVLEFLLEYPLFSLRSRGWTWKDISSMLSWIGHIDREDIYYNLELERMIEINELCGLPSPSAWKNIAAELLKIPREQLERSLFRMDCIRGLLWDETMGGFSFRR